VKLVDQILAAKKSDSSVDTTELENYLDVMIYHLYELTYEEVKIIDSDFWLSEEEYDKLG
ncbi:MAG: hypothetical protein D4R67_10655, partial [Bacteroidetes bacterium]